MEDIKKELARYIQYILKDNKNYTEDQKKIIDIERAEEIAFNILEDEGFQNVLLENVNWYIKNITIFKEVLKND